MDDAKRAVEIGCNGIVVSNYAGGQVDGAIGRLWVWGLSIMGEAGVRHVMKSLLADFDILMDAGGFQTVEDFRRDRLGRWIVCSGALEHPDNVDVIVS